jgi:hypothetical protein
MATSKKKKDHQNNEKQLKNRIIKKGKNDDFGWGTRKNKKKYSKEKN